MNNKNTTTVTCPGCGNVKAINASDMSAKMEFQCTECETRFSITFKTDEEDNLANYMLATDILD